MPPKKAKKEANVPLRKDVAQLVRELADRGGTELGVEGLQKWMKKLTRLEGAERLDCAEQLVVLGRKLEARGPGSKGALAELVVLITALAGGQRKAADLYKGKKQKQKVALDDAGRKAPPQSDDSLWK